MIIDISDPLLFNECYIPLLKNEKRYIFLKGGAGSGKSTFQAQKEIIKLLQNSGRLLCIRQVYDTIKESMFAELVGVINEWGLEKLFHITKSPLQITCIANGSDIVFKGLDSVEKLKSIRRVNRVWIEEATEITNESFNQIDLRLRGTQKSPFQITCTFNPTDVEHWLNQNFCINGNTDLQEVMTTTYLDNRFVGAEYKEVMERMKERFPNQYKIYALGEWGSLVEGLIFQYSKIDFLPKEAELLGYGLDFGYSSDETACVALYRYGEYVILDEVIYQCGLSNKKILNILEEKGADFKKQFLADSSAPKDIDELYSYGLNIYPCVKGAGSIDHGIKTMQGLKLMVTKQSINIIKEFNHYAWSKDKNGKPTDKPIDSYNHAIDASRYIIQHIFGKNTLKKGFIGAI